MLSQRFFCNNIIKLPIKNKFISTIHDLEKKLVKTKKYEMSESHVSPFIRNIQQDFVLLSRDPFVRLRTQKKNKYVTK